VTKVKDKQTERHRISNHSHWLHDNSNIIPNNTQNIFQHNTTKYNRIVLKFCEMFHKATDSKRNRNCLSSANIAICTHITV